MKHYDELYYPFNSGELLKDRKSLRKRLLAEPCKRLKVRIAVLGGSTTDLVIKMMELFLLNQGIEPQFYQSEYAAFYTDAVFDNAELDEFKPELIYIFTTNRNITVPLPKTNASAEDTDALLQSQFNYYKQVWESLRTKYHCPIIQNNFEKPLYRLLGNRDTYDHRGQTHFFNRLNAMFGEYAAANEGFYICDIDYISSWLGLDTWYDLAAWYMYKYAMKIECIPFLAMNAANIIKAIYGKNKKVLALDMDNTLWGGIIGDDGVEHIELGTETPVAQCFLEFQDFALRHKQIGVLLTVNSKNEHDNAMLGLSHPDSRLCADDFAVIKANWNRKDMNIAESAAELNLGADSFVFADDNPVERGIVREGIDNIAVPELNEPTQYIKNIAQNGFFEVIALSDDDLTRSEMYRANKLRTQSEISFADYGEYLASLDMVGEIDAFRPVYMQRIAQLTNKSNQFNVTTRRYTQEEIEALAARDDYITRYGRLTDKYGDNGVVAVALGRMEGEVFHIELFLMSCRVLKRGMEQAMLDSLVAEATTKGAEVVRGYYYPTAKNNMVSGLFDTFGFTKIDEDDQKNTVWELKTSGYQPQNKYIKIEVQ